MLGIGLRIWPSRNGGFSPAALFAGGENGAWFDPSDLSKMFSDIHGGPPVTTAGDRIGLALDKSQGLELGAEIVAPLDFQTGWSTSGATVTFNSATSYTAAGIANIFRAYFTVGRWYKLVFQATFTGQIYIYNATGASNQIYTSALLVSGTQYTFYFKAVATQLNIRAAGALTVTINNIAVAEIAGNHAMQATAAARPTLRVDGNGKRYLEYRKATSQRLGFDNPVLAATAHSICYAGNGLTSADAILGLGDSAVANSARNFDAVIRIETNGGSETYNDANTSLAVVSHVFTGTLATDNRAWKNAIELGVSSAAAGATLTTAGGAFLGHNAVAGYGDWNIYDMVIINRALTDTERSDLEDYVGEEAGLGPFSDAFLMIGQSNMAGRAPYDSLGVHPVGTRQWNQSSALVAASVPLDHPGITAGDMGLDVSFADEWIDTGGNRILFIPYAPGSTGFNDNNWNPGDSDYNAAVSRANAALAATPGARLRAIIWLQGEQDALTIHPTTEASHAADLDAMIAAMRAAINGASSVPFILGQIPNISGGSFDKQAVVRLAIADTPNRVADTAFADNTSLTKLGDGLHYDAASLRIMGVRLCTALRSIL